MAKGRLRVVAGSAGGLRLESPAGQDTRPTTERVREAVLSSLGRFVEGVAVLDLYAGTGAMAIEALSRGAARAVLVERHRAESAVCARNLDHTGFAARSRVVEVDVVRFLAGLAPAEAPFGLVCCDPPYDSSDLEVGGVIAGLAVPGWLAPDARVVVERPAGSTTVVPNGWEHRFSRTYGDTLVHLLSAGRSHPAP